MTTTHTPQNLKDAAAAVESASGEGIYPAVEQYLRLIPMTSYRNYRAHLTDAVSDPSMPLGAAIQLAVFRHAQDLLCPVCEGAGTFVCGCCTTTHQHGCPNCKGSGVAA